MLSGKLDGCWKALPAFKSRPCWVLGQGNAGFLPPVCCRIIDVGVLFQEFVVFLPKIRGVCQIREPQGEGDTQLHWQLPLPGGSTLSRASCPPGCCLMPAFGIIPLCTLYLASPSSKRPRSAHPGRDAADGDACPCSFAASGGGPSGDLDKALLTQHSAQTQGDFISRDKPSLFLGCGVAPVVTSATAFPNASKVEQEE